MASISSHERKKREICRTALDVFSERGFEGTTLEAVAETLNYTKPALYYYFGSKEEMFRSIMLNSLVEADERIAEIAGRATPASSRLRDIIHLYLEDHFTHKGYFSICHVLPGFKEKMLEGPERSEIERLSRNIPQLIIGIIRQGVESGEFIAEDPNVLGGIVFGMMSGILIHIGIPALAGMGQEGLTSMLDRIILKGISA
jgi:TetR/AcrR family transcriptional regulator, cholesterol catabolism regulator